MFVFNLFFFIIFLLSASSSDVDYYWKEYDGTVPPDALPGGKDLDGRDTYIGQAYIHNHGLYVVQIYPGIKEVEVPCYGVKTTNKNIKILCTNYPDDFFWLPTSALQFQVDIINKHAVIGGYDSINNKGLLNIGRLMYQGILKIGEVGAYSPDNAIFFFPNGIVELKATLYEVLILINSTYNFDPRFKQIS